MGINLQAPHFEKSIGSKHKTCPINFIPNVYLLWQSLLEEMDGLKSLQKIFDKISFNHRFIILDAKLLTEIIKFCQTIFRCLFCAFFCHCIRFCLSIWSNLFTLNAFIKRDQSIAVMYSVFDHDYLEFFSQLSCITWGKVNNKGQMGALDKGRKKTLHTLESVKG